MEPSPSTAALENAPAPAVKTHDSPKKREGEEEARCKDSPPSDTENMPAPVVATLNNPKKGEEEAARCKDSSPSTANVENAPAPTLDNPATGGKEEARSKDSFRSTAAAEDTPAPTLDDPIKGEEQEAVRGKESSPSTAAAENEAAPTLDNPIKGGEQEAARSMDPSPSTAVEENVPSPAVAILDNSTKEEEDDEKARTKDSSPSIDAAENAPAPTLEHPKKGEEEEARSIDPSPSTASPAEEAPAPLVATLDKPNKGKEKVEAAKSEGSSSSTAAPENAAAPTLDESIEGEEEKEEASSSSTAVEEDVPDHEGLGTLDCPLRIIVGRRCHLVVVTNRADEASEWVRRLPPEIEGKVRVIGLSSYRYEHGRRDGYVYRRVVSLHLSYLARVLVYYLAPPESTLYSPEVMSFLRRPSNVFVGSNVNETLYLLGVPYRLWSRQAMELVRVAQILEAGSMIHIAQQTKVPLHILLAMAFLNIRKDQLRADRGPIVVVEWPPAAGHVDFAVETAVISQSLGIRAYIHETMPPQQEGMIFAADRRSGSAPEKES